MLEEFHMIPSSRIHHKKSLYYIEPLSLVEDPATIVAGRGDSNIDFLV
jgi:hypothetical protein